MAEAVQATAAPLARRGFGGGNDPERGPSAPRPGGGGIDPQRRRRARRTTILLVVVALVFYFGYIVYAVLLGLHRGAIPHAPRHTAAPAAPAPASPGNHP